VPFGFVLTGPSRAGSFEELPIWFSSAPTNRRHGGEVALRLDYGRHRPRLFVPVRFFEKPDWPSFLDDFHRHWPTDEDHSVTSTARAYTQSLCAPFNRQSADKAPRLRRLKRAGAQKSTGLLPQRTHCYGGRPDIRKLEIQACAAQDKETLSTGEEPSGRYTVWGDLSAIAGITRTLRSPASWAHFST
jgi:hypothetical protein